MPRLSDTMEEGTILRWLKAEGEQIARGDELVEIETDKATMTYESDLSGTVHLLAAEGDTLTVGQPIASVGEGDRDAALSGREGAPAAAPRAAPPPAVAPPAAPPPAAASPQPAPPPATTAQTDGGRVKASPLARRMAREEGVDLAAVTGSGPGGRIVKADVLAAETAGGRAEAADGAPPRPSVAGVATAKGDATEVELSKMQQTVARRMAESKATIPDFTLRIEVDMEDCVVLRGQLKQFTARGAEEVPTYNDMVVKACALALREHPLANGSYRDGKLALYSRVNVGVAVAAESSLVVPTIFDADAKALGEIARETRALAGRVRDGSITPPELGGGTFTVSNLGMFGIDSFSAIINPPQAAIMSVGSLAQRVVVREGQPAARHTMSLTLVCDHRILYGAPAAEFLARVRALLEAPAALTL
ncbi:MAG: dihydrolipoamide acetyltransferase family protein [Solirubrobacteraceae bacterium]